MMSPTSAVIGIDLGTTYSLVSVLRDGKSIVLPNAIGELLTPSAVSVDEQGRFLVGAAARARAVTHPERTALAFKRDMGTDRTFQLADHALTPQALSALVLAELKRDAEAALGMPVSEAVVTVPAYFGDLQRQATRDAASIAGLKVERIINEPTAAALAYGLHQRDRELRAVVLDLGGGTFDVTVLEIMEGVIEIQASAGDARLGGEDFDQALLALAASRIAPELLIATAPAESVARLKAACEQAKHRLSSTEETRIVLPGLALSPERTIDVDLPLTRQDAEAAWFELLQRIRAPIQRALRDAGALPSAIEEVLLVGGSTRMPCISRLAAELFGRVPLRTLPPDEAVAMGAAVQAGLKSGDAAVEDLVVTDVAPFTLGVLTSSRFGRQLVADMFSPIIERGTVIPCSRVERFVPIAEGQRKVHFEVFQGEHATCSKNQRLGEYVLDNLPSTNPQENAVDVRFTYDLNGILEVEMKVAATGRTEAFVIEQRPGRLTPEALARAREQMTRFKLHPRDALPNTTVLARADALHAELTGEPRQFLVELIAAFRATLEEVLEADLLLHVRDISHPETDAQKTDVQQVLQGLGIDLAAEATQGSRNWLEILNKIDLLAPETREQLLAQAERETGIVPISAVSGEGCDDLLARIEDMLATNRLIRRYRVPHDQGAAVSWLYQHGEVLDREDRDEWAELIVRLAPVDVERFTRLYRMLPIDDALVADAVSDTSSTETPSGTPSP